MNKGIILKDNCMIPALSSGDNTINQVYYGDTKVWDRKITNIPPLEPQSCSNPQTSYTGAGNWGGWNDAWVEPGWQYYTIMGDYFDNFVGTIQLYLTSKVDYNFDLPSDEFIKDFAVVINNSYVYLDYYCSQFQAIRNNVKVSLLINNNNVANTTFSDNNLNRTINFNNLNINTNTVNTCSVRVETDLAYFLTNYLQDYGYFNLNFQINDLKLQPILEE